MIADRLLGGGGDDDRETEHSIAEMDERYADVVALLHQKPEECVYLAMSTDGLHFWYNFDEPDKMADFLELFAIAVHEIVLGRQGDDAADALLARVLAECIAGGE